MIEVPLKVIQTSALLEIIHTALGLVKSSLLFTCLQSSHLSHSFLKISSWSSIYFMGICEYFCQKSRIILYESFDSFVLLFILI